MIRANEAGLRMMLAFTLQRPPEKDGDPRSRCPFDRTAARR